MCSWKIRYVQCQRFSCAYCVCVRACCVCVSGRYIYTYSILYMYVRMYVYGGRSYMQCRTTPLCVSHTVCIICTLVFRGAKPWNTSLSLRVTGLDMHTYVHTYIHTYVGTYVHISTYVCMYVWGDGWTQSSVFWAYNVIDVKVRYCVVEYGVQN